ATQPAGRTTSPVGTTTTTAATTSAGVVLEGVRFERMNAGASKDKCPSGCDRVVIGLSSVPPYALTSGPNGRLRLELKGVRVPEAAKRELDVTSYKGPLKTVATFSDPANNTAIIEIDRAGDAQGAVGVEGSRLVWTFDVAKRAAQPSPIAKGTVSNGRAVTIAKEEALPAQPRIETSIHDSDGQIEVQTADGAQAGFTSSLQAQAAQGRYTGR